MLVFGFSVSNISSDTDAPQVLISPTLAEVVGFSMGFRNGSNYTLGVEISPGGQWQIGLQLVAWHGEDFSCLLAFYIVL